MANNTKTKAPAGCGRCYSHSVSDRGLSALRFVGHAFGCRLRVPTGTREDEAGG
jgi:hypothetical protein